MEDEWEAKGRAQCGVSENLKFPLYKHTQHGYAHCLAEESFQTRSLFAGKTVKGRAFSSKKSLDSKASRGGVIPAVPRNGTAPRTGKPRMWTGLWLTQKDGTLREPRAGTCSKLGHLEAPWG